MANKKKNSAGRKASKPAAAPEKTIGEIFGSPMFISGAIFTILFVFSSLFMYIDSSSVLANAIYINLGGSYGLMAFVIPVIFVGVLIYLVAFKSALRAWIKLILCAVEMTVCAAIIGLFANYGAEDAFLICSSKMNGGGFIGVYLGKALAEIIGSVGAFLVYFVLFVILGCVIAHYNIYPVLCKWTKNLFGFSVKQGTKLKEKTAEYAEKRRAERMYREEYDDEYEEYEDKPEERKKFFAHEEIEEELPESLSERRKRKKKNKQDEAEKAPYEKRYNSESAAVNVVNSFADELALGDTIPKTDIFSEDFGGDKYDLYNMKFNIGDEKSEEETVKTEDVSTPEPEVKNEITFDAEEVPEGEGYIDDITNDTAAAKEPVPENDVMEGVPVNEMKETPAKEKKLTNDEKLSFRDQLDKALSEQTCEYKFPTLDLLDKSKHVSNDQRQELYEKAQSLISVLDNFGVKARPVQVTQGPTVTRYEIQPSQGIKLSKIVGLADDIALNMAVSTVLISPVPGKAGVVGVEIPNAKVTPVTIREMLESDEFRQAKSKLTVCLGKDIGGNVVVGDVAKWPHALIAGATGSGKSVCINTIVTSLLYKAKPDEVKLIMIDPKQVELGVYNGIPHLLVPVVTEAKKAAGALNWAVSEMMKRYELFKETGTRKLEGYNKLMEQTGGEKLPQIVIIIDELADLMMVAAKEVEDYICRLAQLARAAGIHLIIATQRPSVDVITGLIKANVPSRIAFFVSSQVDSRTILDKAGAEKLLGMGDMLYHPTGARAASRVQGAFVSDGEVERIVDYIKDTSPQTHYSEDLEEHIERIASGENGVTPDVEEDGDPLLNDAINMAIEMGKISTSMIQRRLSVGYSRAGRLMDQMEARGIVSPANGSKPRDVLVSHADMTDALGADTEDKFE